MAATIDVYCPAGFSYIHDNYVRVFLTDAKRTVDVTEAACTLINAAYPDGENDTPPYAELVCSVTLPPEIRATYGESFGLEDWINALEDLFSLTIVSHDGEEYPT